MITRVSSTKKEKQAKRENRAKKTKTKQKKKKKNDTKKQKMRSPGVEPGSSAGASNSLTTAIDAF